MEYLFAAKVNRISLVIVPGNTASARIAEKCGSLPLMSPRRHDPPSAILNECGRIGPYSERCA